MRSGQGGYSLAHPRRPGARALADRHQRLGVVHPSAGRHVRLDRGPGPLRPVRGAAALPLDIFVVTVRRAARILAEYAAIDGPSRDAAALVAGLPAIAQDARQSRASCFRSPKRSARRNSPATCSSIWGQAFARPDGTPATVRSRSTPPLSPTPSRCSTSCTRCTSTWCRTSSSAPAR